MERPFLLFLRYWLPAAVCAVGVVILIAGRFDEDSFDGAGAFFGAGLSIWLLNLLLRIGTSNESDRDREEEARAYYDRHGRWPDER